jgi:hypothetical protein
MIKVSSCKFPKAYINMVKKIKLNICYKSFKRFKNTNIVSQLSYIL